MNSIEHCAVCFNESEYYFLATWRIPYMIIGYCENHKIIYNALLNISTDYKPITKDQAMKYMVML